MVSWQRCIILKDGSPSLFSLAPDFLAKMQCPGGESLVEFSFPALTEFVGVREEDSVLCPASALLEYLQRTKDCHCSQLFVSVSEARCAVHPHTLCGFAK